MYFLVISCLVYSIHTGRAFSIEDYVREAMASRIVFINDSTDIHPLIRPYIEQMQRNGAVETISHGEVNDPIPAHRASPNYQVKETSEPFPSTQSRDPQHTTTLTSFNLRALPIEIRLLIYRECIKGSADGRTPTLIRALRSEFELYQEALQVFYSTKQCSIRPPTTSQSQIKISPFAMRKVVSLRVWYWLVGLSVLDDLS